MKSNKTQIYLATEIQMNSNKLKVKNVLLRKFVILSMRAANGQNILSTDEIKISCRNKFTLWTLGHNVED